jgi:hypothetical protein
VALLVLLSACAAQGLDLQPPSGAMLEALRAGASHPCNRTTASVLEAIGFAPGQIKSVRYDSRLASDMDGDTLLQGYNAWVTFTDQKGYVIVSVRPSCMLTTYYARSGARLPPREEEANS